MLSVHDVVQQMVAAGLEEPPLPLDLSGRVRRFGPKKAQWYRLRETRTAGGSFVVVGSFGDWRGQRHSVSVDWKGISAEERQAMALAREQARQAEEAKRRQAAELAACTAAEMWARAQREGFSDYLKRKGVHPEACRYLPDGALVIPLLRYDEPRESALKALQIIRPDGTKRFTRGFQKAGVCLRLGHVVVGEPMLVCEGYATGLTLRMAVDRRLPVFVALDADNLIRAAELLRGLHPQNHLLLCADDDWRTPGNPGRQKAHKAAKQVADTAYTWPCFRPGRRGPKDTDFNDLHAREGLGAVRRQLMHVLPLIGSDSLHAAA
jgi:putative DNA primase/helicase